jgi:hypothetical protein
MLGYLAGTAITGNSNVSSNKWYPFSQNHFFNQIYNLLFIFLVLYNSFISNKRYTLLKLLL